MAKHERKSEFTYNHARRLYRAAQKTPEELFVTLKSSYKGLTQNEVQERLKIFGENHANDYKENSFNLLKKAIRNPINYLICGIAIVSYFSGNGRASVLMIVVVFLSITMTFIQETRFKRVVNKLLTLVQVNVTVIRNYGLNSQKSALPPTLNHEIPITELVPGDIVRITAGDIIPADIRLLSSKNLLVNQSVLTGETVPVDKDSEFDDALLKNLPDLKNVCFLGSSVVNGTGIGIVIHTGHEAYVSSLAKQQKPKNETSFDNGIHTFVLETLKFMLLMIILVSVISLVTKGGWSEALLFAITITVSLTPKSLPLTISGNLTRAALRMLKKRVVVKHLSAIQNLGAMNILCTDKTGTLTEDLVEFGGAFNSLDSPDNDVLLYAYLNSFLQTGLKNHLDFAIIKHVKTIQLSHATKDYEYLDELPFDSSRKRTSLLIKYKNEYNLLICKGALEEILPLCSSVQTTSYISMTQKMNELGNQAVAVSFKIIPKSQMNCQVTDEENLTLLGYISFSAPPVKKDIPELLKKLNHYGVSVKIMTGDNHWDTIKVANEVGIKSRKILLGSQIDSLSDEELRLAVEKTSVYAKLSPDHKQRIIHSLQDNGHTVGYLGDGINDVPALFASDVGISVSNAVSTAKESSDIVLLEKSLSVLIDGIIEGRTAFINIDKYIKINSVTKFGAAVSMLGASIFLPFLPMIPIQMLVQNLVFEFSQSGMPFDKIDEEQLMKPSKWEFAQVQKFRLSFGPILSLFDFITFALMWFYFNTKVAGSQNLFQSAWLIESLVAQAFVLHLFHTKKIDLIHNIFKPSFLTTVIAIVFGIYLPFSPLAHALGFAPLPKIYFIWMIGIILSYCILTELLKIFSKSRYVLRI